MALSDAEGNTFGKLNRGRMTDLPLLRTLSAVRQKPRGSNSWEEKEPFVLLAYASLAASRTTKTSTP